MALITFTSDLGMRDFYVAAVKGAIISHCGYVPMVDVTHAVKQFDIKEAAFTVRNAYRYFPKGTIHLVHVNASEANNKLLVAIADGHYFITFDNGFLSLAFEKTPHQTYQVNDELLENGSLLHEGAIAKVIDLLEKEYLPRDFGHVTTETVNLRLLQPICSPGSVRGTIVNIDHYGNAVTNISQAMFADFIGERRFTVLANVGQSKTISKKYTDVEVGDMVCLFNAAGYLEVGMNKGKAELLMGLKVDMPIMVLAD
ncbi:MAG TPA: SAM-dependent chlorinase/fluorinase [Chitinophagales bacterium]|nr:SAM-dependent chlorinase/fluorinase [Chitinophagales bacterium]